MVSVVTGDLFESNAQTLVNTVNCVGVMGKGVALEFKRRFPEMYKDYEQRCVAGLVRLGEPYLFKTLIPPWIVNFPTKDHWRSVSRLIDIINGLEYLEQHYREWGITSLAVPPLGCGFGQLEWRVVGPNLYRALSKFDIPVELYAPPGTPQAELDEVFLSCGSYSSGEKTSTGEDLRIPAAWVALVDILARIEQQPYHWQVGRIAFQKIAYFATESGIPTNLTYKRGSYGPFAADLKKLMTKLVNNGLLIEERSGSFLVTRVGMTYADAAKAYKSDLSVWEATLDRIADLFLRMDTTHAEIAATVHFVARELMERSNGAISEEQVLDEVKAWKIKRRPPLKEKEIAQAIRNLNLLGWIDVEVSEYLPIQDELYANA